jgi:hypothetical protein
VLALTIITLFIIVVNIDTLLSPSGDADAVLDSFDRVHGLGRFEDRGFKFKDGYAVTAVVSLALHVDA